MSATIAPRSAVFGGARAMAPWLFGIAPYGFVIGVTAADARIPTLAGWLTGPLIFTGSAQVTTIHLLDHGVAPVAIVAVALLLNVRLALYSATMAGHWRSLPRRWRALAAYALVDPSLAVGLEGYEHFGDTRAGHRYYLGGAVTLWAAWLGGIALGALTGSRLPPGLHLELVVPLFFVGEIARRVTSAVAARAVAVTVAVATLASLALPVDVPLVAMTAGILTAFLAKERDR